MPAIGRPGETVLGPERDEDEPACADEILTRLARRAYRRPATAADISLLRRFYDGARAAGEDWRSRRLFFAKPEDHGHDHGSIASGFPGEVP